MIIRCEIEIPEPVVDSVLGKLGDSNDEFKHQLFDRLIPVLVYNHFVEQYSDTKAVMDWLDAINAAEIVRKYAETLLDATLSSLKKGLDKHDDL